MRIISKPKLAEFWLKHSQAETPLSAWYYLVLKSSWNNINDVKASYPSVDYVGNDRFVFNISGNKYRLVVIIKFNSKIVYIRFIGTHSQYNIIKADEI